MSTREARLGTNGTSGASRWSTEGRRPKQLLLASLCLCVVAFSLGAAIGNGSYVHVGVAVASGFLGLLVALASVTIELVSSWRWRRRRRTSALDLAALFVLVFSPFAGLLLSGVCAELWNGYRVHATRGACQELIRRIDEHVASTGSCPQGIDPWRGDVKGMGQLSIRYHRDSTGGRYRLGFLEGVDRELSGTPTHFYDSERASWFYFDAAVDFSFEAPIRLDQSDD